MSSATSHKAESEHEMTEMPRDDMAAALLGSEENNTSHIAAFHCLLHLVPLGGALTLLALHWNQYWIGNIAPDSTILQFVAKIHELLMQVSIVEAILCIIRSEAVHGFLPLGALSGAIQPTQLSYLWSLDFLSSFSSDNFQGCGWRRLLIAIAVPVLIVSTALVGPSSAVLMIPGPGCPNISSYRNIYYGPVDAMFPTKQLEMNWTGVSQPSVDLLTAGVPHDQEYEFRYRSSKKFYRMLCYHAGEVPSSGSITDREFNGAKATISTSFAQDILANATTQSIYMSGGADWPIFNLTTSVVLPQPITEVFCVDNKGEYSDWQSLLHEDVHYVQGDGTILGVLSNMSSLAGRVQSRGSVADSSFPGRRRLVFDPVWLKSPETNSQSLLGIFVAVESTPNTTESLLLGLLLTQKKLMLVEFTVCSLTAYWSTAESSLAIIQSLGQPTRTPRISKLKDSNRQNITLDPANITLNPSHPEMSWKQTGDFSSFELCYYLAAMFAIAISEIPALAQGRISYGSLSAASKNRTSKAVVKETCYGYGYCADSTSIRLSLAVILAYCVITVAYLTYILISGETSTAWNSAIELVVLALQSKKPEYPNQGHTGVGIDSLDTFRQGVGIRVNNDNELELVFANDRDIEKRGLRKIERNTAY